MTRSGDKMRAVAVVMHDRPGSLHHERLRDLLLDRGMVVLEGPVNPYDLDRLDGKFAVAKMIVNGGEARLRELVREFFLETNGAVPDTVQVPASLVGGE